MAVEDNPSGGVLIEALTSFAGRLREFGVAVSTPEVTDAVRAACRYDPRDREALRRALKITMVKRAADLPAFEAAYDAVFPAPLHGPREEPSVAENPRDLAERLAAALRAGATDELAPLVNGAIDAFAGLGSASGARESATRRYYEYRVLRQLDISSLLQRAMRLDDGDGTGLERWLARMGRAERLEEFRRLLAAELAARVPGPPATVPAETTDFLRAGPAELDAMRAAVRPLARRIAAAARRRRRLRSTGRLDVHRTLRRAAATGGVPLDPAWRRRRPSRPRLVVLCDVSGSVAEFAKFTLSLLHALHAELPRLRSFVFVDGACEVTGLVASAPGVIDARHLLSRPGVVRGDGHSDYGATLRAFADEHPDALTRDTVLIVCGDARTNHRPPDALSLRDMRGRVRRIHWLNPEPATDWNTTDSRMDDYAPHCDTVTEVRNLTQLASWVQTLL